MTLFVFLKMPKNTIKLGETATYNLDQFLTYNLDQFLTYNLDQFLTYKTPNLGPIFNFTAYIYMPITSFDGPLLGFKKSRSRGKDEKLRQKRQRWERRQNIETWKTPTPSVGVFWVKKSGKKWNFDPFGPLIEVMAIYIYIWRLGENR